MRPLSRSLPAVALSVVLALGGCATGPRYANVKQGNSATLTGSQGGLGVLIGLSGLASTRQISQIDGLPSPGTTFYLSPGKHNLELNVSYYLMFPPLLSVCDFTTAQDFTANHEYRFTSSYNILQNIFDVSILDETGGAAKPVSVGNWKVIGQVPQDDEADPVPFESVAFGGDHSRPPLDRGGGASHEARPPSIPHNPRPSPGGGGGGHSGGGSSHGGARGRP